jgi:predicted nuclease with TOPRIM domain
MTFEETMHTIEAHLEALQAERDRLLETSVLCSTAYDALKERNNQLLEENNQLKEENAYLLKFKKANTPMYKGDYSC